MCSEQNAIEVWNKSYKLVDWGVLKMWAVKHSGLVFVAHPVKKDDSGSDIVHVQQLNWWM